MQKLVAPYSDFLVLAGFMVPNYRKEWKFDHLGVDLTSVSHPVAQQRKKVYALGDGTVCALGEDSRVGNVVVIIYPHVVYHNGKISSLAARCFHLEKILVNLGDTVTADTIIGIEGNTGTGGIHLHLELDPDIDFPCYSTQVAGGSIIKKGTTPPVNPMKILHKRQGGHIELSPFGAGWNNEDDANLPLIVGDRELCNILKDKLNRIKLIAEEELICP